MREGWTQFPLQAAVRELPAVGFRLVGQASLQPHSSRAARGCNQPPVVEGEQLYRSNCIAHALPELRLEVKNPDLL